LCGQGEDARCVIGFATHSWGHKSCGIQAISGSPVSSLHSKSNGASPTLFARSVDPELWPGVALKKLLLPESATSAGFPRSTGAADAEAAVPRAMAALANATMIERFKVILSTSAVRRRVTSWKPYISPVRLVADSIASVASRIPLSRCRFLYTEWRARTDDELPLPPDPWMDAVDDDWAAIRGTAIGDRLTSYVEPDDRCRVCRRGDAVRRDSAAGHLCGRTSCSRGTQGRPLHVATW